MTRLHRKIPHLANGGRGVHAVGGGHVTVDELKAPFPWFGGKSRAASLIWPRFGDVPNYVEPFFGSGAVLLARPHAPRIETVNDVDAMLCNFWRSIKLSPDETARYADGPVNETDLHSRHRWLVARKAEVKALMMSDPDAHDPKVAGWWVWGLCAWIGSGWCSVDPGESPTAQMDNLSGRGMGVHRPALGAEVSVKLPHLGNAGRGVHRGQHSALSEQLPHLGGSGMDSAPGVHAARMRVTVDESAMRSRIHDLFAALSRRVRGVRVACGDFERVLSDSVTWRNGTTAVLLDPPYADGEEVYSAGEGRSEFARAARWAEEHGADKRLRIALCGYEGTWTPPAGWSEVSWKAKGGYGSQRADGSNQNAKRERIWFSPGCVCIDAVENSGPLFGGLAR